jgi:hypothetical protein
MNNQLVFVEHCHHHPSPRLTATACELHHVAITNPGPHALSAHPEFAPAEFLQGCQQCRFMYGFHTIYRKKRLSVATVIRRFLSTIPGSSQTATDTKELSAEAGLHNS